MKIVHIITRLIVGGAQENTLLSCAGQHARGHEVTLLTGPPRGPEGSLLERAQGEGYRVIVLEDLRRAIHPVRDWRSYRALVRELRHLRPEVVHTHSSKAGILGRRAAWAVGVPAIIHTVHGLAFTASTRGAVNWVYRQLERYAAPLTTRIVCVADALTAQSLAGGVGRPEQYVTVYSGMEIEPFLNPRVPREEVRRKLGIRPDDVVAGTIARLFHLKGHEDLLAHAPALCAQCPQLRFLWVGDGLLRGQFEAEVARLGLNDRFIFTGLVPPERIPELAGAMDILVHPSRREGLARALPQGQLAGCPVIVYDIDGNREGFVDGQTGVLIPPFAADRLAEALRRLVEDAPLRRRMGEQGRQFAAGRFSAAAMVEALEAVYQSALATRGR
jgi:glycosyltransferase involved in cell wall biosynthesis